MAESGLVPPRLPEPPMQIDRQYMEDLVRAIEFFIAQDNKTKTADEAQSVTWFMD
jgi:hypothetical protein